MSKRFEKMVAAAVAAGQRFPAGDREEVEGRVHRADADGYFDNDDEPVEMVVSAFVMEYC